MWRSLTSRVALAGAVIAVLFVALVLVFLDASDAATHSWRERNQADRVLDAVDQASDEVIDVETGLRGYALTREERFLQPFWSAEQALPMTMSSLVRLTDDAPGYTAAARDIEQTVAAYVHGYALPLMRRIRAGERGNMDAEATAGKEQVDRLRASFDRLQAAVRARQQVAADHVTDDAHRAKTIAIVALGAALLLLIATIYAVARGARALDRSNDRLELRVAQRTEELERSRVETLQRLARAAEWRDDATHQHAERIGRTAALLGHELGLDDETCEHLRRAAPLHDIGKISTPDAILLKPGRLTADEVTIMRNHAAAGAQILSGSESGVLRLAEEIARSHHERWDGGGYPSSLAGEDIPLSGRIVAVADVFDALTHARPYKGAWPIEQAVAEVHRCSGTHFDPAVVAAFGRLDHSTLVHAAPGARHLVQVA